MTIYYLYVKTHTVTGLKYLGKTTAKDPHMYLGSGTYWNCHLNKHGKTISTEIIKECHSKEELKEWGLHYSNLWNVVSSDDWANLKPENGDGGSAPIHSEETRKKRSVSLTGLRKDFTHTNETRDKMSQVAKGRKHSPDTLAKMSEARKGLPSHLKGKVYSEEENKKRTARLRETLLHKHSQDVHFPDPLS